MPSSQAPIASEKVDARSKQVEYLDTIEAYDRWSEVYDTDGNFLQALDTLEMQTLLPSFLSLATNSSSGSGTKALELCKFIDLGCGTGRNTLPLHRAAPQATTIGLEPSSGMLDIARRNVYKYLGDQQQNLEERVTETGAGTGTGTGKLSFEQFNLLDPSALSSAPRDADGIISTLVLEHVPTTAFFAAAAHMLRPGGILLLTNMHSDMGAISQAGFVDPVTKIKIRPTSYAHTIEETVRSAADAGLEVVGELKEQSVDEELAGRLGPRAKKWIGVKVWYGGCFIKK